MRPISAVSALILLLLLAGVLAASILWMAGWLQSEGTTSVAPIDLASHAPKPDRAQTSTITVMTWNIAWAYGAGSEGRAAKKSEAELGRTVDQIGDWIRQLDADIVLLQEVDFDSARSHGIDQAKRIATRAGLSHIAPAVSWRANYVPFPYWPPSEHWGRMLSGGAILSRFPIKRARVELLEKPASQHPLYRMFYLFRYVERADVLVGDRVLKVYNAHLEAFDAANRETQAEHVARLLESEADPLAIFGGDLNTVPPEAEQKRGYEDEPKTDHTNDRTLARIRQVHSLPDVVSSDDYQVRGREYFTFPATAPNRKLDYLFVGAGMDRLSARVAREVGHISDHLPLVAKIALH